MKLECLSQSTGFLSQSATFHTPFAVHAWRRRWISSMRIAVVALVVTIFAAPGVVLGQSTANLEALPLDDMSFRLIGPFRGGRSVAVAGHPTERLTFYFGSTGGGIWKTEDAGDSWHNVSDGFVATGSVGALAVATIESRYCLCGYGRARDTRKYVAW